MVLPFVILFVPLWAGVLSGETLLVVGHVLMLPRHGHCHALPPKRVHPGPPQSCTAVVAGLIDRELTGLAWRGWPSYPGLIRS